MQFAAAGECVGSDDAGGARECGALGALVRLEVARIGPSGQLAMGGELQCLDLVV
jgi:hypothetical protein